jgi:iron complex transport system permease protein
LALLQFETEDVTKANRARAIKTAIIVLPLIAFILSIFIGRYELGFVEVVRMIFSPAQHSGEIAYSIVYDLRIPRAILGLLVGGILAASGASLQGMFKNPLVDSGMLGVSSGAGFGAIVGIIAFGNSQAITILFAFGFGLIAVLLAYMIGTVYKSSPKLMLVLGGVIVSALFSSLISMGKFVADPTDQLPSIVFWLMGSLANVSYAQVLYVLVPVLVSAIGLSILGWKINVLSMGERDAHALGINTRVIKILVVALSALGTAAAVSVVGTIGWIGLVIPHIVRMLLGSNNRVIIPYSFLLGAGFLALIDILARTITSAELPIGMLTSFIGLPFYVFLLRRTKGGGW